MAGRPLPEGITLEAYDGLGRETSVLLHGEPIGVVWHVPAASKWVARRLGERYPNATGRTRLECIQYLASSATD